MAHEPVPVDNGSNPGLLVGLQGERVGAHNIHGFLCHSVGAKCSVTRFKKWHHFGRLVLPPSTQLGADQCQAVLVLVIVLGFFLLFLLFLLLFAVGMLGTNLLLLLFLDLVLLICKGVGIVDLDGCCCPGLLFHFLALALLGALARALLASSHNTSLTPAFI